MKGITSYLLGMILIILSGTLMIGGAETKHIIFAIMGIAVGVLMVIAELKRAEKEKKEMKEYDKLQRTTEESYTN